MVEQEVLKLAYVALLAIYDLESLSLQLDTAEAKKERQKILAEKILDIQKFTNSSFFNTFLANYPEKISRELTPNNISQIKRVITAYIAEQKTGFIESTGNMPPIEVLDEFARLLQAQQQDLLDETKSGKIVRDSLAQANEQLLQKGTVAHFIATQKQIHQSIQDLLTNVQRESEDKIRRQTVYQKTQETADQKALRRQRISGTYASLAAKIAIETYSQELEEQLSSGATPQVSHTQAVSKASRQAMLEMQKYVETSYLLKGKSYVEQIGAVRIEANLPRAKIIEEQIGASLNQLADKTQINQLEVPDREIEALTAKPINQLSAGEKQIATVHYLVQAIRQEPDFITEDLNVLLGIPPAQLTTGQIEELKQARQRIAAEVIRKELETADLFQKLAAPTRQELSKELADFYLQQVDDLFGTETKTGKLSFRDEPRTEAENKKTEAQIIVPLLARKQVTDLEYELLAVHQSSGFILESQTKQVLQKSTEENLEALIKQAGYKLGYLDQGVEADHKRKIYAYDAVEQRALELTKAAGKDTHRFLTLAFSAGTTEDIPSLTIGQALLTNPKLIPPFVTAFLAHPGRLTSNQLHHLSLKIGVDYLALRAYLSGHTSTTLDAQAQHLLDGYSFAGLQLIKKLSSNDPRVLKIKEFANQLRQLEKFIESKGYIKLGLFDRFLFAAFRTRAKLNFAKYKIHDTVHKYNPFRPILFARDFSRLKISNLKGLVSHYQHQLILNIKKRKVLRHLLLPRTYLKIRWRAFLMRHHSFHRLLKFFPHLSVYYQWNKLKDKIRRRLRQRTYEYLMETGFEKLAEILKEKGFKLLIKAAVKKMAVKAVAAAIGTAIGGPLGTAIGFLIGLVIDVALKVASKVVSKTVKAVWNRTPEPIRKFIKAALVALAILLPLWLLFTSLLPLILIVGGLIVVGFFVVKFLSSIVKAATGLVKGAASIVNSIYHAITGVGAVGVASAAPAVGLGASTVGVGFFALIAIASFSSAFLVPLIETQPAEELLPSESKYIKIEKTADKSTFQNSDLASAPVINYTVTITAKENDIIITKIEDRFTVNKEGAIPTIPSPNPPTDISQISAGQSKSYSYQLNLLTGPQGGNLEDSYLINAAQITYDVASGPKGELISASFIVSIGSPPGLFCNNYNGIAYCFPISPLGRARYDDGHHDYPAADIFACGESCTPGNIDNVRGPDDDVHLPVVAYVGGRVLWVDTTPNIVQKPDGTWIWDGDKSGIGLGIAGEDGRWYYYGHLYQLMAGIQKDTIVTAGQPLGLTDSTGNAVLTPEHLHFHINPYSADLHENTSGHLFVWPQADFNEKLGLPRAHLCDCQKR